MKPIKFENAPEFERPPRTHWEPLIARLMDDETLFLPGEGSQKVASALRPWAVRKGRRVRVQLGRRAGVEGTYVWFEKVP